MNCMECNYCKYIWTIEDNKRPVNIMKCMIDGTYFDSTYAEDNDLPCDYYEPLDCNDTEE